MAGYSEVRRLFRIVIKGVFLRPVARSMMMVEPLPGGVGWVYVPMIP